MSSNNQPRYADVRRPVMSWRGNPKNIVAWDVDVLYWKWLITMVRVPSAHFVMGHSFSKKLSESI